MQRDVQKLEGQLQESIDELVSIKQKISAGDTDLLKRYGNLRETLSRSKNGLTPGGNSRATRISQIQQECGELSEEMEKRYLMIIHKNIVPNVNDEEADALKRLAA